MAHLPLTKLKTTLSGGSPVITNIYKYGTYHWETLKCQQSWSAVQRILDARHPHSNEQSKLNWSWLAAGGKILSFWHLNIFGNTVFEVFPSLKYLKIFACGEQQLFWTYKQTYIENRKSDQSNHGPPPGGWGVPARSSRETTFARDICCKIPLWFMINLLRYAI